MGKLNQWIGPMVVMEGYYTQKNNEYFRQTEPSDRAEG
jgi:hypothetical protein